MKSPVRRSANVASARPRRRSARGGPLAEDLGVGQQHEPELAPDEAAARRRDREEELRLLGKLGAGLEHVGVGAAEQVLRPQRLAGVREGDDDAVAGADEAGELLLGLGEPARRERRPLRLEGERLRLRERVELGRALQSDRVEPLLRPDARAPPPAARRSPARGRARGRDRRGRPAPHPPRQVADCYLDRRARPASPPPDRRSPR